MIIAGVKRREEIIKIWWVAVFLDFYIRFLMLGLKSPGALTLGLTCRAFLFSIFFYWFIMWQTGEKKTKGIAFWDGELDRRGRDKKYTRDE